MSNLFKNLIERIGYLDVYKALVGHFPTLGEKTLLAYMRVLMLLKEMPEAESNLKIVAEWEWGTAGTADDDPIDGYWSVGGMDLNDDSLCRMDFVPWAEWLGSTYTQNPALSDEEFVALCLWEMTFYGFEEKDVRNIFNEIEDNIDECICEMDGCAVELKNLEQLFA